MKTLTFLLLFMLALQVTAQDNFKKDFGQCQSFLKKYCGSMKWEDCAKKEDKQSEQVIQCVKFYVENKERIETKDLQPSFQSLVKDFKGNAADNQKCIETARLVCGDDMGFKDCFQKQAGRFPSYCRDMARNNVDKMQAAYDNDPELQGCTNQLMSQCQKELAVLGDENITDQKRMMASMNRYQKCVKEILPKVKACESLVNVKKDKPLSPSVQKIYQ